MFEQSLVNTKNEINLINMMDMMYYNYLIKSGVMGNDKNLHSLSLINFEKYHEKIKC